MNMGALIENTSLVLHTSGGESPSAPTLPRLSTATLQDRGFHIRTATASDKVAIVTIWRKYTSELGGVQIAALNRSIKSGCLHVAIADNQIVGFVEYYARLDSWHTIYHIAVDNRYSGLGIGAALLWSVPCPIRLKVTGDNFNAIRFYEHHNMKKVKTETLKSGRLLFTYELRTWFIQCAGNNTTWPILCKGAGIGYGSRHDDKIKSYPHMIDINWNSYDWREYINLIKQERPLIAMVADYESPEQKYTMLKQVHQLRRYVVRVMVCPKFDTAIADIPNDCVIAISVPSKYAGYIPPLHQLRGKKIHLLGGSPVKQREYALKIAGHGGVIVSMDGNSHTSADGRVWDTGRWQFPRDKTPYHRLVSDSARNIACEMQYITLVKQLPLFAA
jgi:ribosomal protein S18 acetylase RimI-like enzyme